jgi:hypothetical protein
MSRQYRNDIGKYQGCTMNKKKNDVTENEIKIVNHKIIFFIL